MSLFHLFKKAVDTQYKKLSANTLYTSGITKDELYDTYLGSFAPNTNNTFRERTEHDCNCCKKFIRTAGSIVGIVDGKLESIWDVVVPAPYQVVADALAAKCKIGGIAGIFLHYESEVGRDESPDNKTDIIWQHFHMVVPKSLVLPKDDIATLKSRAVSNHAVLKRSLDEISVEAVTTVLELIDTGNLYKGNEYLGIVTKLANAKLKYKNAANKEEFLWAESLKLGRASAFRNTVIGSLLVDLSEGKELADAVGSFESKVAPDNYKRSSALLTDSMIKRFNKRIIELDLEDSLPRRAAVTEDLTINNVIYADRNAKQAMGGILEMLTPTAPTKFDKDKAIEIPIRDFLSSVLPNTTKLELMLENAHRANLMTLVAPVNPEAKGILKWDNNFSWSYMGDITDSMKENVKAAGGNVTGDLRFSIQWNGTEQRENLNDLDAHCVYPNGRISFQSMVHAKVSGTLDTDVRNPRGVAVENIIFTDRSKMPAGKYKMGVHNFRGSRGRDFTAQVECGGVLHEYSFEGLVERGEFVEVATVTLSCGVFTVEDHLPSSSAPVAVWGLTTQQFYTVDLMCLSPNHWDGNAVGNKHFFFLLNGCKNPDSVRGLYNEFLSDDLHEDRKVFEHLGAKLKAPYAEDQLSGLGFSDTQRNEVTVKADHRLYTIKF